MLYIVSDRHHANECPGKDPQLLKVLASRFSKTNLSKRNIKIIDGYVDHSCVLQTSADHLCMFIVEANSPSALIEIFKPLQVEVNQVIKWQGFESKVKQAKIA